MEKQTPQTDKQRPVKTIRDGSIETAIWRRETDKGPVYNTERSRSYLDKDNQWQKTRSIPERDLLRAARVDQMAYDAIQQLREQDRQKYIEQQQKQAGAPSLAPEHPREH